MAECFDCRDHCPLQTDPGRDLRLLISKPCEDGIYRKLVGTAAHRRRGDEAVMEISGLV